jgi:peptide/nickel transport system permease protein
MLRTLAHRAVAGAAVVFGVVTLTFFLLRLAPGDPVARLVGPTATAEQLAAQRAALEFDRPLLVQYAEWLRRAARGDWGRSIATGRPVAEMLGDAWPRTVSLVAISLLISYVVGIVIGAIQATRSGSVLDTALSVGTVTLFAMPGYWLGLMLVMLFSYWMRVLPAFGAAGLDADFLTGWARLADQLQHLVLPVATLVLIGIGGPARYVRGAMLDVLSQPFVAAARAKGLSATAVLRRHVLRNALIPVLTLIGLSLPALFSGVVFVEAVFAWPGVGGVLVQAVQARDYPVVMAAATVSALLVVAGNMLADVLAAAVDPRVRGHGTLVRERRAA